MAKNNYDSKHYGNKRNFLAEQFDMDDGSNDQDYRYYDDEPLDK